MRERGIRSGKGTKRGGRSLLMRKKAPGCTGLRRANKHSKPRRLVALAASFCENPSYLCSRGFAAGACMSFDAWVFMGFAAGTLMEGPAGALLQGLWCRGLHGF